jgi:hypothetical protein
VILRLFDFGVTQHGASVLSQILTTQDMSVFSTPHARSRNAMAGSSISRVLSRYHDRSYRIVASAAICEICGGAERISMTLWVFWGFKRSLGWADGSCSSDIKTQQRRGLIDADLLLAKERNLRLRSCDWNLLRYLSHSRTYCLHGPNQRHQAKPSQNRRIGFCRRRYPDLDVRWPEFHSRW